MNTTYQNLVATLSKDAPKLQDPETGVIVSWDLKSKNDRPYFYCCVVESYKSKRLKFQSVPSDEKVFELYWKLVNYEKTMLARRNEDRQKRKASRDEFLSKLNPGTVLSGSWGYGQTNVEFFIVLEKQGNKVKIQELGHKELEATSWASCNVMPDLETKPHGPIIEKVVASQWINIHDSCSLSLWDGKPKYKSWYY